MKSTRKSAIILIIMVSAMFIPLNLQVNTVKAQSSNLRTVENEFQLQFNRTFDNAPKYEQNRSIPNVDEIVNNITNFIGPNMTVYTGSETPTQSFLLYQYRVKAIRLHVINDHDTIGAGDMFLKGWVNQMIDDQMSYSEQWRFDLGEFNNGDNKSIDCLLYEGWASSLSFWIELYDDDSGFVDTFGTYIEYFWNPTAGIYIVNYNNDAYMQLQIEIFGVKVASAQDILDAYKPYLYSDVETIYDDPAEFIFGRVIEGRDPLVGKNTTCLQYLYYFPYEYTGTNKFVHYDDYEMILIYLDFETDWLKDGVSLSTVCPHSKRPSKLLIINLIWAMPEVPIQRI